MAMLKIRFALLLAMSLCLHAAGALIVSQEAKLDPDLSGDGAAGDRFGWSVDISGDTAVVGSYRGDANGRNSGSAYVFTRTGTVWSLQQKLVPLDGLPNDHFGYSVAVDGDSVIVGAYQADAPGINAGSAYVFTRSGTVWSQQQKLTASDSGPDEHFGYGVDISGDSVIVGGNAEKAYVFTRSGVTWTEQQILTPGDSAPLDAFGYSVSMDGDYAAVGAYQNDDDGLNSGSAYVFLRTVGVWAEQQKLTASDAAALDHFGYSISISGDSVIAGAYQDDDGAGSTGSAYVFTRSGSTWTQQQKLTASDAEASDQFGISVAISGDSAAVGAYLGDEGMINTGSAYLFTRVGSIWTEQNKLVASDAAESDYFGFSTGVSSDSAIAGAFRADGAFEDQGAAYVFSYEAGAPIMLTISGNPSDQGAPGPLGYGVHFLASGTPISNAVLSIDDDGSGTRYLNAGWTGTGNVPASGATNSVVFTLTTDSTLTWNWTEQFALVQTATVAGAFAATATWFNAGALTDTLTAPELITGPIHFVEWSVDGARVPDTTSVASNPVIGILMDAPHTAVATYLAAGVDTDGDDLDDWFERHYFGTNDVAATDDPDGDGADLYHEQGARTDPFDAASVFTLSIEQSNTASSAFITFTTEPLMNYTIEYSDDWLPGGGSWTAFVNSADTVGTWAETSAVPSAFIFEDEFTPATSGSAPAGNQRLYRIEVQGPTVP